MVPLQKLQKRRPIVREAVATGLWISLFRPWKGLEHPSLEFWYVLMKRKLGKKLSRDKCIFCGKRLRKKTRTKDHTPPRCLFPRGRNLPLITVPSCRDCHEGESKDVEYFRLAIAFSRQAAANPQAEEVTRKSLDSFLDDRATKFRRSMAEKMQRCFVVNENGFFEPSLAYELDEQRIANVVTKTVQGLLWHNTGLRLPKSYGVAVFPSYNIDSLAPPERAILLHLLSYEPEIIGKGIFDYRWDFRRPDGTCDSVWWLRFYENISFLCFVMAKEEIRESLHRNTMGAVSPHSIPPSLPF